MAMQFQLQIPARRPACTHMRMNRLYGNHQCRICHRIPRRGWVYQCTQDHADLYVFFLTSDGATVEPLHLVMASLGRGRHFVASATPRRTKTWPINIHPIRSSSSVRSDKMSWTSSRTSLETRRAIIPRPPLKPPTSLRKRPTNTRQITALARSSSSTLTAPSPYRPSRLRPVIYFTGVC